MTQTKGLNKALPGTEDQINETALLSNEASNEEKNRKVQNFAYEKEDADMKEKRKNVWYHVALTLDTTTFMVLRHVWKMTA